MTLVLKNVPATELHCLLPDPNLEALYADLVLTMTRTLGPEHASVLARPQRVKGAIQWTAEGAEALSWTELSEKQQADLKRSLSCVLSDIRRQAELFPSSSIGLLWPSLRQLPNISCVYAVDGRPVLACWGHVAAGHSPKTDILSQLDDNVPPRPAGAITTYKPYHYIVPVALAATITGILAGLLWHWYHTPPESCRALVPLPAQVEDVIKLQKEGKNLTLKEAELLKQIEFKRKLCQMPKASKAAAQAAPQGLDKPLDPLPPPPDVPLPKAEAKLPPLSPSKENTPAPVKKPDKEPPPEKKADLPQKDWQNHKTSMLKGCWHLTTHLNLYSHGFFFERKRDVRSWSLCFDAAGHGRQVLTASDGDRCTGPLSAGFRGDKLVINEPSICRGDFSLIRGQNVCTRLNDHQARCTYTDEDGRPATGIFKR